MLGYEFLVILEAVVTCQFLCLYYIEIKVLVVYDRFYGTKW
jgi:hypothetical protein